MERSALLPKLRLGGYVFLALAVLTAVEYWAALTWPRALLWAAIVVTNLLDAGLIVWYFMHLKQLWRQEEE